MGHHHHRVERRAALVRRAGRVRGDALEAELRGDDRERAGARGDVAVVRVPVQDDVGVVEEAGAHHVDLAVAALFGRRAVVADGAGQLARLELRLDGQRRRQRRDAQQVVAAAVPGRASHPRLLFRARSPATTRQRVELAHDPDHRLAAAPRGDKSRRHAGHALVDAKARGLQLVAQQRRALRLLVADLRVSQIARESWP